MKLATTRIRFKIRDFCLDVSEARKNVGGAFQNEKFRALCVEYKRVEGI